MYADAGDLTLQRKRHERDIIIIVINIIIISSSSSAVGSLCVAVSSNGSGRYVHCLPNRLPRTFHTPKQNHAPSRHALRSLLAMQCQNSVRS